MFFLGELGLKGLREIGIPDEDTGAPFTESTTPIDKTIGYSIELIHKTGSDGKINSFLQTQIPEDVWGDDDFYILRRAAANTINKEGKAMKVGATADNPNVVFQMYRPPSIFRNYHSSK